MCTMTWWRDEEDYGVFFNRDEQKTRERADPPFLWPGGFLAPRDPGGGGTWIAVNRAGLILALLNRWHEGNPGTRSRGLLIPELAQLESGEKVGDALQLMDFQDYSPFTLVAIDAHSATRWDWTSAELLVEPATAPITSSSFRFEQVRTARRERFDTHIRPSATDDELDHYHQESAHGAYSVRMLRPDAQTWSRSKIHIAPNSIDWEYLEEFQDFKKPAQSWPCQMGRK